MNRKKRKRRKKLNQNIGHLKTTLQSCFGDPNEFYDDIDNHLVWRWHTRHEMFAVKFIGNSCLFSIDDRETRVTEGGSGINETLEAAAFFAHLITNIPQEDVLNCNLSMFFNQQEGC